MLKQFTIFFILSGFGATCLAAEDHLLRASFAHLKAGYRIEPQLSDSDLCQPSGCDYTVYEGIAEVVIELDDETSRLRDMWFLVNGEQISNTDVSILQSKSVVIYELSIASGPGYLPLPLREEIIGLGVPYIYVRGIMFESEGCDTGLADFSLVYDLESQESETSSACAPEY